MTSSINKTISQPTIPLDRTLFKAKTALHPSMNKKNIVHAPHEQKIEINISDIDSGSDSEFIDIESLSTDSDINKHAKLTTNGQKSNNNNHQNPNNNKDKDVDKNPIQLLDPLQIDATQRKTMYLHGDQSKPVTAAGALFYKKVGGKLMLLVIEKQGKYEDIGGKIEKGDTDIYAAVSREVEEETNGQIKSSDVIERVKNAQCVYVPKSKYLVHLIEANVAEKNLTKDDFGNCETFTNTMRTVGWISHEELTKTATIQHKMNWRLKSKSLMSKLIDVENQMKFKNNNLFKNLNPVKTTK